MSSIPFAVAAEAGSALAEALRTLGDGTCGVSSPLSPIDIAPRAATLPRFDFDAFSAALKASPSHKAAVLFTARAKQSSTKQKVPMSAQQSKVVGLVTAARRELSSLETQRVSAPDADALRSVFFGPSANCVTSSIRHVFSILEAPPGTGKSVHLPIVLSGVEGLKKGRIIHVVCEGSSNAEGETSRALAAHAVAAKVRLFSVDTEQFVASVGGDAPITSATRVVIATLESFAHLLVTAVTMQRKALSDLQSGTPVGPFTDPFADVGVVSFDHLTEDSFASTAGQPLTQAVLRLLKAYYALRVLTSMTSASTDDAPLFGFSVPQCIFTCPTSAAAAAAEDFFAAARGGLGCLGFAVARESIKSPCTSLFDDGSMPSRGALGNETAASIVTDALLGSSEPATGGPLPIVGGRLGPLAWLHSRCAATDAVSLRSSLSSVSFRAYEQQLVPAAEAGGGAWLMGEAVRCAAEAASSANGLRWLAVVPDAADVAPFGLAASEAGATVLSVGASGEVLCSQRLSEGLEGAFETTGGHYVVVVSLGHIGALSCLLPSRYSSKRSAKGAEVFDAVLSFVPPEGGGPNHALLRQCCLSASAYASKPSSSSPTCISPLIDLSALVSVRSTSSAASPCDGALMAGAIDVLTRGAELAVLYSCPRLVNPSAVRAVADLYTPRYAQLLRQGIATLCGVPELVLMLCGASAAASAAAIDVAPSAAVRDVVGEAQSLVCLTPVGLHCLLHALLLSPTARAEGGGVFVCGRRDLFAAAFGATSDSETAAVARAAADFPVLDTSSAAGQVGAVLGAPTVTLSEVVAPVRCRGWMSPMSGAWRSSKAARAAGIAAVGAAPTPVAAVAPKNDGPNAARQLHQQLLMRLYQHKRLGASSESDDFDIDGGYTSTVTPEEVFPTLLAPLIGGGGGAEGTESRVAMSLREVALGLEPRLPYAVISEPAAPNVAFPRVSAGAASHLLGLRSLAKHCVEEYLAGRGAGAGTIEAHIAALVGARTTRSGAAEGRGATEEGRPTVTARAQRTRRGAAAKADAAAPIDSSPEAHAIAHVAVSTLNVTPFIPLIRYSPVLLSSAAIADVAAAPMYAGAPLLTSAVIASRPEAARDVSDAGADRPYAVLRRALAETYGYAEAYLASGLASLWHFVPSLALSMVPVEAARRVALAGAREDGIVVDQSTPMLYNLARPGGAGRRLTVHAYLTERRGGGSVGRRYASLVPFRTRRGEWLTTSPLRSLLAHRFLAAAAHFAAPRHDALLAAFAAVMDTDATTAVASFAEAQLMVWMSVLLAGNDEDAPRMGVAVAAHHDTAIGAAADGGLSLSEVLSGDKAALPVVTGGELRPKAWHDFCAHDVLVFGRSVQNELADIASLRRSADTDAASFGDAPSEFLVSAVDSYERADTYALALKSRVAHSRGVSMADPSVAALSREALAEEMRRRDPAEVMRTATPLRLFCYRQQSLLAAFKAMLSAVDADSCARRREAFLRGSALRSRAAHIVFAARCGEVEEQAPPSTLASLSGTWASTLAADAATLAAFTNGTPTPTPGNSAHANAVPCSLRLLALAIRVFNTGSLSFLASDEARRFSVFADHERILAYLMPVATGASSVSVVAGSAAQLAGSAAAEQHEETFAGVLPPPAVRSIIDHVAREVASFCNNDQAQRRDMELRLSGHGFLTDPSTAAGPPPEGSQYHAYYLHQLRRAAPEMSWLGDANDAELYAFLLGIEEEVAADLREAQAAQPAAAEKRHRAEGERDHAQLMAMLHVGGGGHGRGDAQQNDDFAVDEPAEDAAAPAETADDTTASVLPTPSAAPQVQQPSVLHQSAGFADVFPASNGHDQWNAPQQASTQQLDETALLMQRLLMETAPVAQAQAQAQAQASAFSTLLDEAAPPPYTAYAPAPVEAAPIFDAVPNDVHPLSMAPPPIPIDPTAERRYSVIVFPLPDVHAYQEAQRAEGGEAPHINLPNSLAMALGASLDRTVGPTFLIGNVARIDLPSRGLEQRAIQQGAFMCLGARLRIIPNTRIFDNPALVHERGRGRGRGGRGRGGPHGADNVDGESRSRGYRGRGGSYGMGRGDAHDVEPPQFTGGSLLPLPPPMGFGS